jgi:peptidoglycan/LPS O-acetylase OafA/YrhL
VVYPDVRKAPQVSFYFPAVDGLRGLAILSVLLYHTSWFAGGLFGVDVFMVLSGFLITLLLFREGSSTGSVSLARFYRRRFKRLMPGLSITLLAVVGVTLAFGGLREAQQVGAKAIAALFQYANWLQIANGDAYWEGFGRINPLAHMWSLSITEQFYLVWPLLFLIVFWVCRRAAMATTVVITLFLAGSALVAPLMFTGANTDRLYLGTDARAVDFLAGAATAGFVFTLRRRQGQRGHQRKPRWTTIVLTIVGLAALAALVAASVLTASYRDAWLYRGGIAVVAVVAAIAIATLCHDRGPLVRIFSFGPLAEVGRISYTMYLLHVPIYWLMQKWLPTIEPYALFIVGGGITWLASMAMHYAVTERLRLRPWRPARAVPTSILVIAAILAGGIYLPVVSSYRMNPGNRPVVLMLGDSVSADLAEAIALHGSNSLAAVDGSIAGCGAMAADAVRPVSGVVWPRSKQCAIRQRLWRDRLHSAQFKAIVVHFGWDAADQQVTGTWMRPCDPAYERAYRGRLADAITLIKAEAPGVPVAMMNERVGSWAATPEQLTCYNQILRSVAGQQQVRVLDLNAMLCPPQGCTLTDPAGRELFADGVHFTDAGRAFVAPMIEADLFDHVPGLRS